MLRESQEKEFDIWESLREDVQAEYEQTRREQREITLMLEQSQLEVNKLAQRNASITTHLQQVHAQFDRLPRPDIRMAYDAALDAQQRLFVMRGQLEKLQSDQTYLERHAALMERVLEVLSGEPPEGATHARGSAPIETLEMMIQAQEVERQRLSRQMHDGPAQALSNFILQTEIAQRLFDLDQGRARDELTNLKITATSAFQQIRDFIFELRPMMLDDLGLVPTIKRYVEGFKEKSGLDVRLVLTGTERRLESYLEVMIFRSVQELLSNAVQNNQANQIKVHVDISENSVRVDVEDNGRGLEIEDLDKEGRMGLKVIKDRVEMLGGFFEVDSMAGQGSRINYQVPAARTMA